MSSFDQGTSLEELEKKRKERAKQVVAERQPAGEPELKKEPIRVVDEPAGSVSLEELEKGDWKKLRKRRNKKKRTRNQGTTTPTRNEN